MKDITFLIVALFILTVPLAGQEHQTITVKAGTRVIDYFPFSEQYRYPEFIQGKVMFKNGNYTITKLNYCILQGEMQFIQSKDTLAIANAKDVSFVQIMLDTFYYDNGYLEVLSGHDPVIMAVKQYVKLSDVQKEGAYGTRSSTSAVQTYSGIYDQGSLSNNKLVRQEDLVLSRNTDYYIGNSKNGFLTYKKSNVLKLFPLYKSALEDYLKKNAIDFKAKEDLLQLTKFLQDIK
jgi:hypothetical protein